MSFLIPAQGFDSPADAQTPDGVERRVGATVDSDNVNAERVETTARIGTVARVTAGGPAPGQIAKNYSGTFTLTGATASIPLETVTPGRTYFITDIEITVAGGAGQKLCQVLSGALQIFGAHANTTKGIEMTLETQPFAVSGAVVTLAISGAVAADVIAFNIYGYEA